MLLPVTASDCIFRAVDGAASFEDLLWTLTVGSMMGREEVDGSCSWVAMLEVGVWQICLFEEQLSGGVEKLLSGRTL